MMLPSRLGCPFESEDSQYGKYRVGWLQGHVRTHNEADGGGRGLSRGPSPHPRVWRRDRRALLLPASQQPPRRRRRDSQAQGLLRRRARTAGRGTPRLRTLRRQAGPAWKTARGAAPRVRRRRGKTSRRRRVADRRGRAGEQVLEQVPSSAHHQHPRLRAARPGRRGQPNQAGDLPARPDTGRVRVPARNAPRLRTRCRPCLGRIPLPRPLAPSNPRRAEGPGVAPRLLRP